MNRIPLPRLLCWLLNGCLAALFAIGLAGILTGIARRYTPGWLESAARQLRYLPASWQYDYVHWLYSTYMYEAFAIGILGGLLLYWTAYDRIRLNVGHMY